MRARSVRDTPEQSYAYARECYVMTGSEEGGDAQASGPDIQCSHPGGCEWRNMCQRDGGCQWPTAVKIACEVLDRTSEEGGKL